MNMSKISHITVINLSFPFMCHKCVIWETKICHKCITFYISVIKQSAKFWNDSFEMTVLWHISDQNGNIFRNNFPKKNFLTLNILSIGQVGPSPAYQLPSPVDSPGKGESERFKTKTGWSIRNSRLERLSFTLSPGCRR